MLENHVLKRVFSSSAQTQPLFYWMGSLCGLSTLKGSWKWSPLCSSTEEWRGVWWTCSLVLATSFQHLSRLTAPPGCFEHAQGLLCFLSTWHVPCELPQDTFGGLICLLKCLVILEDACSNTTHPKTFPHPLGKIGHSNFWHNLLDRVTYGVCIISILSYVSFLSV